MNKISAVVLTKNEEANIKECLETLKFCDEVIVIDDNSTDNTRAIATKLLAKVYKHELANDFSKQLNFGIEKTKHDWVLFIEPDERITKDLASEILRTLDADRDSRVTAYKFKRQDFMKGKPLKYGETASYRGIRLVKKGSGQWKRRVHQYYDNQGFTGNLDSPIFHNPHQTLNKFIENINRWSTLHAIANKEEGKRSTLFKIVFWPLGHFIKNYILKIGFLDGVNGFVLAVFMSFHSYLSWSKLCMLQKRKLTISEIITNPDVKL